VSLVDTHCHLTHPRLRDDAEGVVARARAAGLTACITIGTGVEDAERALELARRHPGFVHAAAGLDPFTAHAAGERFAEELERLGALLRAGGFRALGEIGLDYHYELDPPPVQAERLERQLELAAVLGLPVVIHVREAHADMAALLARHSAARGVIHSFTAGPAEAERYLDLGWHLAFNGVLTYRSADDVREAARLVPAERLLLETDSPYLAPAPVRGRTCEPAFVAHVRDRLAELRGEPPALVAERTTANARRLFGLGPVG
jgi:TatD DNase family protein